MGCDIHLAVEFQVREGERFRVFANDISVSRNCCLFTILAGVRDCCHPGHNAIDKCRGFPRDMAAWPEGADHSESWLWDEEIMSRSEIIGSPYTPPDFLGVGAGNFLVTLYAIRTGLREAYGEKVRIRYIFGFDS